MLRTWGIALGMFLAAAAGFSGYRLWAGADAPAAQMRRPDFALLDLGGTKQPVAQWDGKVLVVNFWATWCEPCRREIPMLQALHHEYAGRGVQVVGIAIDEAEAVRRFAQDLTIDYPMLVGEQDAVDTLGGFGAEMTVLPYTAFVGRDGTIATLHAGELSRDEAVALLTELL